MKNVVRLFRCESMFLDKVCENMIHDFNLDKAVVGVFALSKSEKEGLKCEKLYHNVISEDKEKVDLGEYLEIAEMFVRTLYEEKINKEKLKENIAEINFYARRAPHILAYLDKNDNSGNSLCVDVCTYGSNNKQGFVNLATGITETLGLFRGGSYVSSIFSIGDGIEKEPLITTSMVIDAVGTWLKNDADFQFFREISRSFVKGYFEDIDLLGLGAKLIAELKKSLGDAAKEQGIQGSFMVEVRPVERTLRRAFGDMQDDEDAVSSTMILTKNFKLNGEKHIVLGTGERYDIDLKYAAVSDDAEEKRSLIDFYLKIWAPKLDVSKFRIAVVMSITHYIVVWSEMMQSDGFECNIKEEKMTF